MGRRTRTSFAPQPGKPDVRVRDGHAWIEERLRAHVLAGGARTRDGFLASERARAVPYATRDDIRSYPGGWSALIACVGSEVDFSDLDFDDEETVPGRLRPPMDLPANAVPDGYEVAGVASKVGADGAVREQWLRSKPEAAEGEVVEQLPAGHRVKGVSTLVSGDGTVSAQWIKTARADESREEVLERLLRELPPSISVRDESIPPPIMPGDGELLAVYPMGDPHIGMLSWAPESGESFDLGIAQRLIEGAFDQLVAAPPRASDALIVNLGDYYHSDNYSGVTSRSGHSLDVDGRWPKVLRAGLEIMVYAIDRCLTAHERVRVVNVIGNHDDHSSIMLSVALDAYYRHEPRVEIDQSPAACRYHRHGRVLIGMTHGDTCKPADLESIMAADRAEDWGATTERMWLVGHVHHTRRVEHRGCTVETFRTLAAKDAWHAQQGYRSGRDMNRIVFHAEHGEVSRALVSAAYLQSKWEAT